jgi:hypothetical protein
MRGSVCILAFLVGCAPPLAVHRQDLVLTQVAGRYHAFYPPAGDPDPARDAGLLRPRFGLPAIAQSGGSFTVDLLERGGPADVRAALLAPGVDNAAAERCLAGAAVDGCHLVAIDNVTHQPMGATTIAHLTAHSAAPPGGYDLYLHARCDAPARAPHAVWLRADDPARLAAVRVAHLSDIHIGKHAGEIEDHLRQVINEINAQPPDLVVITGDIVNQGLDSRLTARAATLLLGLRAPLAIVLGNHDIGFRSFIGGQYGAGWENFARAYHPFLEFELDLGGYRFIGFDSGPSTLSPRILTRGLGPETIAHLERTLGETAAAGMRGVVLFSHAPSRAVLSGPATPKNGGAFGHMRDGHGAFEALLLAAAARGQRVLHLAGHTHWSDVFEAAPTSGGKLAFVRWPDGTGADKFVRLHGMAALVTTQAATHAGPWPKPSARGYGYTMVRLGDGDAQVAFRRHDGPATSPAAWPMSASGGPAVAERDPRP